MFDSVMYCTLCGTVGKPKNMQGGSSLLAVLLLICGIIPGVIYILHCGTFDHDVCRECGSRNVIPIGTPKCPIEEHAPRT